MLHLSICERGVRTKGANFYTHTHIHTPVKTALRTGIIRVCGRRPAPRARGYGTSARSVACGHDGRELSSGTCISHRRRHRVRSSGTHLPLFQEFDQSLSLPRPSMSPSSGLATEVSSGAACCSSHSRCLDVSDLESVLQSHSERGSHLTDCPNFGRVQSDKLP